MKQEHAVLLKAMIDYDKGDTKRIQHLVKVHDFASAIATLEGVDNETMFILETAAILHDIGIHASEKMHGNCSGKYQEELGPGEARKLLNEIGNYTDAQIDRVCFLIGHHHTYKDIEGIDYQILVEADFLVNIYEDELPAENIRIIKQRIFRTPTGIRLLEDMYEKK